MRLHKRTVATQTGSIPIILFGAFDRHNFGDLLFPHIFTALLGRQKLMYAGLMERDMRAYGGHKVFSLSQIIKGAKQEPVCIVHVGGELLTCSAWEAAVMLLSGSEADEMIAGCGDDTEAQLHWARTFLGITDLAPYVAARTSMMQAVAYNAVGGTDLSLQNPALRNEVFHKLAQADHIGVRDMHTLAALRAAGVQAQLVPDSAVMVAQLFAETIDRHARQGEAAQACNAYSQGYIALQFSADFGRADILERLCAQLKRFAVANSYGIVLFRAGAAPWHDNLEHYEQLAARLSKVPVRIFHSLNVWDICALIARSRAYCGSSLHGRIVALAFGRPRLTLRHPDQPRSLPTKHEAFVQTWEDRTLPGVLDIEELERGLCAALHGDLNRLQNQATDLAALYRQGFSGMGRCLEKLDEIDRPTRN
ncbi:polysaccharide pyruvyl transferase family protein [Oxalobacteraceae bacterium R-40]|uniref:Polysaccharide pyruvyl transferase family protein n=1 Tax=Keguizhuia sedimenti TaxID=3064264 RepID=A0ABU1BKG0_9BURK|nr:polysaccharide pyruvyl transferase family protein [Oxalobacteraceae bacterium R-40]